LHLHHQPFESVRSGIKTVESRLLDDKRRAYKVGDTMVFIDRENDSDRIEATITNLHTSLLFQDLFLKPQLKGKFSKESVKDLIVDINQYYSVEDQEKYGVVGIEFKVKL